MSKRLSSHTRNSKFEKPIRDPDTQSFGAKNGRQLVDDVRLRKVGYELAQATSNLLQGMRTIANMMQRLDATHGSGFGHGHHIDDGGQRYSWLGKEIKPTVFEIAVTTGDLTDKEKKWLRK